MANQSLALEEQAMSLMQSEGFGYNDSIVMRQSSRRGEKLKKFNPNGSSISKKQSLHQSQSYYMPEASQRSQRSKMKSKKPPGRAKNQKGGLL